MKAYTKYGIMNVVVRMLKRNYKDIETIDFENPRMASSYVDGLGHLEYPTGECRLIIKFKIGKLK